MNLYALVFVTTLSTVVASTAQARTWRDASGRFSIDADFVAASADSVVLKKDSDAKFLVIPLAKLSREDQLAARKLAAGVSKQKPGPSPNPSQQGRFNLRAQGLTPVQKQLFQKYWLSKITLALNPVESAAVSKVFAGKLFQSITTKDLGGGSSSEEQQRIVFDGEKFAAVEEPHTDGDYPFLVKLLKPDFQLKTQAHAKQFEAALDALYEDPRFPSEEKGIKQQGNKWIFIRGKFFEDFSGFVVTTRDGKITNVAYAMKIR